MQKNIDQNDYTHGLKLLMAAKIADETIAREKAETELAVAKFNASKAANVKKINAWLEYFGALATQYGTSQEKFNWDDGTVEVPDPAPVEVAAEPEAVAA